MKKKFFWEIWIENEKKLLEDFNKYIKNKKIKKETELNELIEGHIQKSEHNLKFVKSTLNLKEFNDWAIVSVYYAIYHASLSLCALKGYSTKDHSATLLILIKEFYKKELNHEEIELLGDTTLEKEEVLYYVEAKNKRHNASYSTKINFENSQVEILRLKAIAFVSKVKDIIDNYNIKNN